VRLALACNCSDRYQPADGQPDDQFEEFDASETVEAIADAIRRHGHAVEILEADRTFPAALERGGFEFVFNIAEGLRGRCRESLVPAVCEMLEVPYSGSDAITMGITLDKDLARRNVAGRVPIATGRVFTDPAKIDFTGLTFPMLVKPNAEGSSKGIRNRSRVADAEAARREITDMLKTYPGPVLAEEFLSGPECTVGVLGNAHPKVLGVMEIAPRHIPVDQFVYSIENKRDYKNQVEYHIPARFAPVILEEIKVAAIEAFRALDCRDFSRFDFRLGADGKPRFIECNPLPGLSPIKSDLVIMSRGMNVSYHDLIGQILDNAFSRCGLI